MSAPHTEQRGSKAVLAAFAANLGIATVKFIAFAITSSTSMLAEAVHSVVDSGNQLLLMIGGKRSQRAATPQHPFGYGRDRYVYGFLVALMLFSAGGLFALYEGVQKIIHPHPLESPIVAYLVLAVAIVLESFSLRTAVHESAPLKGQSTWYEFVRRAKVPELPVVLLEDIAALTGLMFALFGVAMAEITGNTRWDGVGTIAIGLLLITVACILVVETKSLLLGESASPEKVAAIISNLTGDGVDRVIHLRTLHLGPEELLVAGKLAMPPSADLGDISAAINAAEERVRAAVPEARVIYLEPDVDRGGDVPDAIDPDVITAPAQDRPADG
jgi:cation diffusion facilitator family transporter